MLCVFDRISKMKLQQIIHICKLSMDGEYTFKNEQNKNLGVWFVRNCIFFLKIYFCLLNNNENQINSDYLNVSETARGLKNWILSLIIFIIPHTI